MSIIDDLLDVLLDVAIVVGSITVVVMFCIWYFGWM